MENNKYNIDDLLVAIADEKPVDVQAIVNDLMLDRAHDEITAMQHDNSEIEVEYDDVENEEEIEYVDTDEILDDINNDDTDIDNDENDAEEDK